ncbi:MAG: purine-binding chemotaxis protein CheW [Clostridiales bacterium]|jgi:purine-binding chemotaxis protein CheW|nr:purine-binding chemotaxis protein CheW [Clostridiales bacterium]
MELQENLHIDESTDQSQNRYLTFLTDGQLFALPIREIVQITQMQEIIPLPEQTHYVKGMINLRGQIIPVIDMRLRFGKQEAEFTERTCIIIVHIQDSDFGFIVDEVDEVLDIEAEQISPPPKVSTEFSNANNYLTGVARLSNTEGKNERVALLLNAGKILGENEFTALSEAVEASENEE